MEINYELSEEEKSKVHTIQNPKMQLTQIEEEEDILKKYSIALRNVGGGMTGDVMLVKSRETGVEYALKTIEKRKISKAMLAILREEVSILSTLDHPNVIHCREVFETSARISILMELGKGGDLFDLLQHQPQGRFRPWIACDFVHSMLLALAHCHAHGIVHRDIKLENFVFDCKGKGRVLKLLDFGLSKRWVRRDRGDDADEEKEEEEEKRDDVDNEEAKVEKEMDQDEKVDKATRRGCEEGGDDDDDDDVVLDIRVSDENDTRKRETKSTSKMFVKKMNSCVGTVETSAPEVRNRNVPYTSKCDMWSIGAVAYALLCGHYPFYGKDTKAIEKKARRGKFSTSGPKWRGVPDEAKMFVRKLLVVDPALRPTATEALQLDWMQHRPSAKATDLRAILESIVEFSTLHPMQRLGLMMHAHFAPRSKLEGHRRVFLDIDKDRSGRISKEEFGVAMRASKFESDDDEGILYEALDQDTSGVNYTEFLAAAILADPELRDLTEQEIVDIFERLDADKSGSITPGNVQALFRDRVARSNEGSRISRGVDGDATRVERQTFLCLMRSIKVPAEGGSR